MKNTQPYIERIKIASLAKGVVLDDKQALEVLTRTVGLVTTETGTPEPCLTTETGTPEPLTQNQKHAHFTERALSGSAGWRTFEPIVEKR
jgi:hypothetical protein